MRNKELQAFASYAKASKTKQINTQGKAVIYTRVSTKEQAENNASLETQKKYCQAYAKNKEIAVVAYFGGTYESAKSDERKHFQKMLTYVKRHKKEISYIIVYSYDRFSRTGANGAYISKQLMKEGIVVLSVTQNVDATTASGSFQQNLYYMFSQFDNELRRDKSVTGMQEKLLEGYWIGAVPFGYTNLNPGKGKVQNIVVNEQGKLLRYAFKWRATENLSYRAIAERLEKKGLVISYKKLSDYFRNPFYCGLVVSAHIPDKVIEGKHEAMVSKELFLKINESLRNKDKTQSYNKDEENLPLKQFVKASSCGGYYTGYLVKKKGLYYYKNNRRGSKENRSARIMHQKFEQLLTQYQLADQKYIAPLKEVMSYTFLEQHKEQLQEASAIEKQVKALDQKIELLEERFVFNEITREQYIKFKGRSEKERMEKQEYLQANSLDVSNLEKAINLAVDYSSNLSVLWSSGDLEAKKRLQNMLFPEGILFDHKNDRYRTIRVNSIFSAIPTITGNMSGNENGTPSKKMKVSRLVPGMGLEPTRN
ncbi:recombinase family protein [Dokdonia ponticola]|uniref:Recombinase family protein n=1 Tax=Dokdonia ponticola TaxID=2041041 RepID=A0ABV9HUJ5_9FLAO